MDLLIQTEGRRVQLQSIPIVGIGGIGKTTLAHALYNHPLSIEHFATRAWITISQEFNLKAALLALLGSTTRLRNRNPSENDDDDLGKLLHNSLSDQRYLIVLDDIWHTNAWDRIKIFFPDHKKGSRILLTTRETTLAEYAKSSFNPYQMLPLSEDASWELFIRKLFKFDHCPLELVETGKNIATKCKGLPLAITTMAGLLSTFEMTLDVWKLIERRQLDSIDMKEEIDFDKSKQILEIQDYSTVKGFANLFNKNGLQLLDVLTGQQPQLQIIPIIGKEGTGKTILAQLLYNRALEHFKPHAWVTISEERSMLFTLRSLLDSLMESTTEMPHVKDDEVDLYLHRILYNRRYLIVLDDMKDTDSWDKLRRFFPDNGNGSRLILTAREWNTTDYDRSKPFCLDSYWEFLLHKAFEQDCCPPELEGTHMNALGHSPLSKKSRVFWELLENNVSLGESNSDLQLDLISMSYDHLPTYLKPCFLYMGAFTEDYEIRASTVIKLWIADGFVRPIAYRSLEESAEMYLKALVGRNLLYVCRREFNGKVKAFKIHDNFWKFCQKKSCEENFLWFKDLDESNIPKDEANVRHVSVHPSSQPTDEVLSELARTFLCIGPHFSDLAPMFLGLALLRALDVLQFEYEEFPEEILELVNLRYLAITCCSAIPSSISIFRNLQTLITCKAFSLPSELWEMTQ